MHENDIGTVIVDCAVRLHQILGPGLLEIVYEVTLARELQKRGLRVERQVAVPIEYDGVKFDEGFRVDLIVDGKVIFACACRRPDTSVKECSATLATIAAVAGKRSRFSLLGDGAGMWTDCRIQ
jgi:GxxExxY protein